jgi:bifunctional lysine-specific demethylase and histidyl-hydroxylase MINA
MMFQEAQRLLEQFLSPLTLDEFLDRTLAGGFARIPDGSRGLRTALLGPDPAAVLGGAFGLAPKLTYHSANPAGPPPSLAGVADAADFRRRIDEFHARNYSVRFPELRPLSAPLDRLARALEMLLHQPVTASAFWSRPGMRAPVHYDDHDLLVVQIRGTKRWHVQSTPSELNNTWKRIPEAAPALGPHATFDVSPGELVYLPRGTLHSVDGEQESLHVSIGFTPLTVRETIIAALDHLSDFDRPLRTTLGARLAFQLRGRGVERLMAPVVEGITRLLAAAQAPGFLAEALQRRSARAVGVLAALPAPAGAVPLGPDSVLEQAELAFCHLTATADRIDLSYPGGHVYIHRGAQHSLEYMVNTPRFRVRDIPGEIADEVRLSLAAKLVEIGYLRLAAAGAAGTGKAAA